MRTTAGLIIASVASAAAAQTAPPRPVEPQTFLSVVQTDENPALLREAWPAEPMSAWVRPDDVPATALNAEKPLVSARVRVSVAADGSVAGCAPVETGVLGDVACTQVRAKGRFRHALTADGKPEEDIITLALIHARTPLSPAPPPPPMTAGLPEELMRPQRSLAMTRPPEWAHFAPPGASGQRDVVVHLMGYRFDSPSGPLLVCRIVDPSGDAATDAATCEALKTAGYGFNPAMSFNYLTLLVQWRGAKASARGASKASGTALVWDRAGAPVPGLASGGKRGLANLTFTASGKDIRCRIASSTGSDAADIAACRHLSTLRYTPASDIFGRKRDGKASATIEARP